MNSIVLIARSRPIVDEVYYSINREKLNFSNDKMKSVIHVDNCLQDEDFQFAEDYQYNQAVKLMNCSKRQVRVIRKDYKFHWVMFEDYSNLG